MASQLPPLRPTITAASRTAANTQFSHATYGIHDTMRHGLHQARDDLAPLHPVAFIQDTFDAHQDHLRLSMLGLTQGQQAVMRLNMERNILSRVWRGPGLPSSNIGLETITGRDDRIAWEDVLNDPNMSEVSPALHETAEARLRL